MPVILVPPHVSCTFHQNHTLGLYLALALFPRLERRRVVMGGFLQGQWSTVERVSLWTRDQRCCSLWHVACHSLSAVTATVSAIAQYSAKALHTAKLLPLAFLPAKVYPSETIHVSQWYQFLTSLVMRSRSKPVEVSTCLSALVCCCHVHANVLDILAEPFSLWGDCWVVLL